MDRTDLGYVDHFRLTSQPIQSSCGVFYTLEDTVTGMQLSACVLPGAISQNPEELERIRQCIADLQRLSHPQIVNIKYLHQVQVLEPVISRDFRIFTGDILIVMEYAVGRTLPEWRNSFSGGCVPLGLALYVCRQLASVLDYAHSEKIVHRDFKPVNVLVEQKKAVISVKILPFALESEIRLSLSRISLMLGVSSRIRPYMAPEQWNGRHQDAAVDQYALAVMFYELVSGEIPFASVFETGDSAIMARVLEEKNPEPLAELSRGQNAALQQALAKDPALRFASCGAFIDTLQKRHASSALPRICLLLLLLLVLSSGGLGFRAWQYRAYQSLRSEYEKTVSADQQLLLAYGGKTWSEVEELAQCGVASCDEPMAGRKAYSSALTLLPTAISEANTLKQAAVGPHLPRLRVVVELDGIEISEGIVCVTPDCRKEDDTFVLLPGETYRVYASLPVSSGKRSNIVEREITGGWEGLQSWTAQLAEVSLRVPPGFRAAAETAEEPYTGTGWAKEILHAASGLSMMFIPSGKCRMGSLLTESGRYEEEKSQIVMVGKCYYLGKTEVTQGQWEQVMKANPSCFKQAGLNAPVENVSWEDCQMFCQKLGHGFCLPTEAQWEYACRAGTTSAFHFGQQLAASMANFDGRYPYGGAEKGNYRRMTAEVAQFQANAWGLYDMHGNVWEWCQDSLKTSSAGIPGNAEEEMTRCVKKATRGGGWNSDARHCRAAFCEGAPPEQRINGLGVRVCYELPVP